MSTLCKSRMVEGQSDKTGYLTAKISVFTRQSDRFCCVTNDTFLPWSVLPIAARVTE